MLLRSVILKTILFLGLVYLGAIPPAAAQGYSQEQQQLCTGDAFRLCASEIPDVDRVTACMVRKRAQLSPGCMSVFEQETVAAPAPLRAVRPAGKAGKAAKVRKANKT